MSYTLKIGNTPIFLEMRSSNYDDSGRWGEFYIWIDQIHKMEKIPLEKHELKDLIRSLTNCCNELID